MESIGWCSSPASPGGKGGWLHHPRSSGMVRPDGATAATVSGLARSSRCDGMILVADHLI